MTYTPAHLTLWTRPDCYIGEQWDEWYPVIGVHRDSDLLVQSNYEQVKAALERIPDPEDWPHDFAAWMDTRANHWAVGWVDTIYVHKDAIEHVKAADALVGRLKNYPVLDEEDFSRREREAITEAWEGMSVRDRAEYLDFLCVLTRGERVRNTAE